MKKILSALICAIMIFAISLPVYADDNEDFYYDIATEDVFDDTESPTVIPDSMQQPWVVDDADVLTDQEENQLRQKLNELEVQNAVLYQQNQELMKEIRSKEIGDGDRG